MSSGAPRARLLLVGGGGGFVGRNLLREISGRYWIRSVHRRSVPEEDRTAIEWIRGDVAEISDWGSIVRDVDIVVNLAWYRWARPRAFESLYGGLHRLLSAATEAGVRRFVQVSVPPAPAHLENSLPYLIFKRRFDQELLSSGVSHAILRPSMLFGHGDVLLTVMLRSIQRYPFFPMFGDGSYRLSPLAVTDFARILRGFIENDRQGVFELGGPETFRYRELTDLLFALARKRPRYWTMSARNGIRFARLLQATGSHLLYAYEVEWLVSDLLGLSPATGVEGANERVRPFLEGELRNQEASTPVG
jgi:uncharacterized protein YbjT (DUF2867 family)